MKPVIPTEAGERKLLPITTGVLDYFSSAIMAVAEVSRVGNDQHNPGQPVHWARGKSMDHADCIVRHLMDRGTRDVDGLRHTAKLAWRALALLQEELEAEGYPRSRGSKDMNGVETHQSTTDRADSGIAPGSPIAVRGFIQWDKGFTEPC